MADNNLDKDRPILAFGELLWDLLPEGKVLGGAPANFAVRVAELGHPAYLISRVGNDELGMEASNEIGKRGVEISNLQYDDEYPTGTVDVELGPDGDPSYTINTGVAYDHIQLVDSLLELAKGSGLICFGTLIQRSTPSREALYAVLDSAPDSLKLIDLNLRKDCFSPETVQASLERADIVKLNRLEMAPVAELVGISEERPESLAQELIEKYSLKSCLVTLGAEGVLAADNQGVIEQVPGFSVTVKDTIGAGDAFTAALACRIMLGDSLRDCCLYGNALGALAATKSGGMSPVSQEELQRLVNSAID